MSLKIMLLPILLGLSMTLSAQVGTWDDLGTRKVDYKVDRDEIPVTITDGQFRKVKLTVEKGDINLHQCIVVFGDGSKQIINTRKRIKAGTSTRAFDLKGGRRVINKIVFVYDTKGIKSRKAKVKLYGLH